MILKFAHVANLKSNLPGVSFTPSTNRLSGGRSLPFVSLIRSSLAVLILLFWGHGIPLARL